MKLWVMPAAVFSLGLGLGISAPLLVSRYLDPYFPDFLKEALHPLEGSVLHKQRQQDRLLITITTQDGTFLATFQRQVQKIDLLIEERDLVTLDVREYEPFVNDPRLLRVIKYTEKPLLMPQVRIRTFNLTRHKKSAPHMIPQDLSLKITRPY